MKAVFYNGSALLMDESAMAELGLIDGQRITTAQLGECLAANARAFCRDMDRRRAAGEPGIPDTSELAAMAKRSAVN